MRSDRISCLIAVTVLPFLFVTACGKSENTAFRLEDTIATEALVAHVQALERISLGNALSRSSASPGYVQAMEYIRGTLGNAGLNIWEQRFEYRYFIETADPALSMTLPGPADYGWGTDYQTLTYSGIGDVTAEIVFVTPVFPPGAEPNSSSDGCEADDFQGIDVTGKIAVLQRGTCKLIEKATNAESRGAVAVLIFNEGQEGRTDLVAGALSADSTVGIPVLGIRYDLGKALHDQQAAGATIRLRVAVTGMNEMVPTYNLFAETPAGRDDQVVLVGAHLDSVVEGPGINDDGSGAAALLEVSRQMGLHGYAPRNKIRFAWWGAEEEGAIGSQYYLDNLSTTDMRNIAMYLNVDCIASHNFIRGVEDGDLSDTIDHPDNMYTETPEGSGAIEQALLGYFQTQNLPTKPTPLTGRTDYMGFAERGIPFGGLFTGLDGIKTEAEALLFGGTAGEPYDNTYHTAGDTVANIDTRIFTENARAVAHVAQYFGDREVTTIFGAPASARSLRAVKAKTVNTYRDRYHKDRRDRPTR